MADKEIQDAVVRHAVQDMAEVPASSHKNETSLLGQIAGTMADPEQYAVLWAEWRRGLKDLQNAVLNPWGGTHEEPGTIANPTPQIVTQEIQGWDAEVQSFAGRAQADRDRGQER